MSEISPIDLGRQLRKPSGELGLKVAENMNSANNAIYDFVLSKIEMKDNDRILEIGFGNGKLISKFFEINPDLQFSAIDFSETMYAEAVVLNKGLIEAKKINISCQDAVNMSFQNDFFDKVVAINVIYFWEDIERQLQEIKRVLKKGGQFVIGYRPKSIMINLPFTQEVFKHYDPEDLQILMRENGFEIIKEETQLSAIKVVDGSEVQVIDICLIAEKVKN
jgi:SAM-dependent methyltransferase